MRVWALYNKNVWYNKNKVMLSYSLQLFDFSIQIHIVTVNMYNTPWHTC